MRRAIVPITHRALCDVVEFVVEHEEFEDVSEGMSLPVRTAVAERISNEEEKRVFETYKARWE